MLRTEQLTPYSQHTDYYQLWLEKRKENQKLQNHLLDSKMVIRTLHFKLTEILKSIKIFEANQDLANSNQEEESLEVVSSSPFVPYDDSITISEEEFHVEPENKSESENMNCSQVVLTENANASSQVQPSLPVPNSLSSEFVSVVVEVGNGKEVQRRRELIPRKDLIGSTVVQGQESTNSPFVPYDDSIIVLDDEFQVESQSGSELVNMNGNQVIPTENVNVSFEEPTFINENNSLHSTLALVPIVTDVRSIEKVQRKQKLLPKEDIVTPTNVQVDNSNYIVELNSDILMETSECPVDESTQFNEHSASSASENGSKNKQNIMPPHILQSDSQNVFKKKVPTGLQEVEDIDLSILSHSQGGNSSVYNIIVPDAQERESNSVSPLMDDSEREAKRLCLEEPASESEEITIIDDSDSEVIADYDGQLSSESSEQIIDYASGLIVENVSYQNTQGIGNSSAGADISSLQTGAVIPHYVERIPPTQKKPEPYKRCVVCLAARKRRETRWMCMVCQVALHFPECYRIFHQQRNMDNVSIICEKS